MHTITERRALEADLYSLNLTGNYLAIVYSLCQKWQATS